MKCQKCGVEIPEFWVSGGFATCLKCSTLPLHYTPHYEWGIDWAKGQDLTATDFMFAHGPMAVTPLAELTPADPGLEAIGRAFDDAIDLAYLT